jgi:outer membrane protein assembly factor BamD
MTPCSRRPRSIRPCGAARRSTRSTENGLYPDTDRKNDAEKAIGTLQEWFADKDYQSGMYYFRRKAFDSAIIYFKDVVKNYPQTDKAREAYLRLAASYDAIRYREDKKEVCVTLMDKYPKNDEVIATCGALSAAPNAKVPPAVKRDSTAKHDSL